MNATLSPVREAAAGSRRRHGITCSARQAAACADLSAGPISLSDVANRLPAAPAADSKPCASCSGGSSMLPSLYESEVWIIGCESTADRHLWCAAAAARRPQQSTYARIIRLTGNFAVIRDVAADLRKFYSIQA